MTRVVAQTITNSEVTYECPHCWSTRKGEYHATNKFKNGKIAKDRKPTVHRHGNGRELASSFDNGKVFNQISHCKFVSDEVSIRITEDTKRINN